MKAMPAPQPLDKRILVEYTNGEAAGLIRICGMAKQAGITADNVPVQLPPGWVTTGPCALIRVTPRSLYYRELAVKESA